MTKHRRTSRIGAIFAAALVACSAIVVGVHAARATATALFPDLKTLAPRDLRLDRADVSADLHGVYHNVLRFSNTTWNVGQGPVIIDAQIDPATRSGPASQRILHTDGTYTSIPLHSNIYWHEAHHHYHFDHWGRYELWTKSAYDAWIASGRTSGAPRYLGSKTTSCIIDEEFIARNANGRSWGNSACDVDSQNQIHEGLTPGWGDTYDWYRQDQWIDLNQNTLGDGIYVLRSVADPSNVVYESPNKADPRREGIASNEATTAFRISGGVILDGNPPSGTVSIADSAPTTSTRIVNVDVIGRDDVSGVNQFRLSNDGSHFTAFAYTSSGSTPTSVSWNLTDPATGGSPKNGVHWVFAEAHDNSGKWGPKFFDAITLEATGPPPPPPPNSTYASAVKNDTPAGYWRLGETSGTSAIDSVGGDPGVYTGSVTKGVPGLLKHDADKAASFSGSGQWVAIASSSPLSPANAVSVEAWIKPGAIPATGAFASVASKPESYSLQFNGPRLEFTIIQSGVRERLQAAPGAVVAGQTYHVVGTYDGAQQRLYLNGALAASAYLTGPITTNTSDLNIASWSGGNELLKGTVDEVAVYRVGSSAAEVANHYAIGTSTSSAARAQLSVASAGANPAAGSATSAAAVAGSVTVGGTSPMTTAVDPALGRIYVTRNAGASNGVSVIDAGSRRVIAQIPTGRWAPSAIVVNPATHLVYVTAATFGAIADHSVVVAIDGRTNRIVRTIPVGPGPKALAVNERTNRVYVTGESGTDSGQVLTVIDGVPGRVVAMIPTGPYARYYDNPLGVAVNARTNIVYATNPLEGTVYVVDGAHNALSRVAAIGDEPTAVAVDEATGLVFVAQAGRGRHQLAVLDGASGAVLSEIGLGADPRAVAVDPSRGIVYVTTGDNTLAVVDERARRIARMMPTGANPRGLVVNPDDGSVAVANAADGTLSLFTLEPRGS